MSPAFKVLPAELSMLNDLSIFAERWRWKRPFGDTEGDPHKHWPADPKAYYLYFPDDATFGKEMVSAAAVGEAAVPGEEMVEGFWTRGGGQGEVIVRALEPVRQIQVKAWAGSSGDDLQVRAGGATTTVSASPGSTAEAAVVPGPPFVYKDTFVYVLGFRSRRAGFIGTLSRQATGRRVGSFVTLTLDVDRRPAPPDAVRR
jgi:hypothetical protein